MQHGWYVLRMVMSGRKICHALTPILDLLRPGLSHGCLRPRGRRRLNAFRARLVDEPLRAAILRAGEQVIQMGGDGAHACCPIGWLCQDLARVHSRFFFQRGRPRQGYAMEKDWLQDLEPVGMLLRRRPLVMRLSSEMEVDGGAALLKRRGNWQKAMAWRAENVPNRVEGGSRTDFLSPSCGHSATRRYRDQR